MTLHLQETTTHLSTNEWNALSDAHFERASTFTKESRRRRDKGEKHPVDDFLFDYYPYPIALVEQWQPGLSVTLELTPGEPIPPVFLRKSYSHTTKACFLDPSSITQKEIDRFQYIRDLLTATQGQPPLFACHGLHEWAMVYEGEMIRHSGLTSLRLPQAEVDELVRSRQILCTHHDAFRFFAKSARPLNRFQPSINTRHLNEQPGCIHANMDLYKWAAKCMPWIGSSLFLEIFILATELRNLDMRASPYDLSAWGLEPVKIETADGRKVYEVEQKALAERAFQLRKNLISALSNCLKAAA